MAGRASQSGGGVGAPIPEKADHIARPTDRDDRSGPAVFPEQQRAHYPGGELADGRVAVGIGRAGNRKRRGKLGVAQAGERADDPSDRVGYEDSRSRVKRSRAARTDKDASADDAANAEEHEVPGA